MVLLRILKTMHAAPILAFRAAKSDRRLKTTYRSGAVKPMPEIVNFGLVGIFCTVIPGLLIGAAISKNMANFLEENELFIPSDDDDDDD